MTEKSGNLGLLSVPAAIGLAGGILIFAATIVLPPPAAVSVIAAVEAAPNAAVTTIEPEEPRAFQSLRQ